MSGTRPALRDARKNRFLTVFATCANITRGAAAAKVSRKTIHDWIKADPNFAERFAEAEAAACDALEAEMWRRGVDGVLEPVWHQGLQVGNVRKYSDTMLAMLVNGAMPEKYRQRHDVRSEVRVIDAVDAEISRLESDLARQAPGGAAGQA